MEHHQLRQKINRTFETRPKLRAAFYFLIDILVVSFWHIRKEIQSFAKGKPKSIHVLDVGSGFGQYTYYLAQKRPDWNIYGIDISPNEVCECNNYFRAQGFERVLFKCEDVEQFSKTDAFEMVMAINVLEYVEKDDCVLSNIYNSLKKGGMALISVQSDKSKLIQPNFTNKLLDNQLLRHRYNNLDFKKKLKELGFTKVKAHYAYGYSGKLSAKLGVLIPKKMIKRSGKFLFILPVYYLLVYPAIFLLNFFDAYIKHTSGSELVVTAYK